MKEVVIITGCSGRVGQAVLHKLNDGNYSIIGLDVIEPAFKTPHFEFMNVDLTSDSSVLSAIEQIKKKYGHTIASVVHLAAYYNFTGGAWEKYQELTINGTKRLLNAVKSCKTEQFLFSSTMLVHAPCQVGEKIDEDSPLIMNWEYPKSKVLTEEEIHKFHESIPTVILRIAGCYDDGCHSIPISNQIQRVYEHQMEGRLFPGDLTHGASYIHLDDLADAIILCVKKRKELPLESVMLIGEEETLSYDTLQRMISKLLNGKEMKTFRIPKWVAKSGAYIQNHIPLKKGSFIKPWMIDLADNHYELDITRAKQLLGWQPKQSLRNVLPRIIMVLKKDPERWYRENGLQMPEKIRCGCNTNRYKR